MESQFTRFQNLELGMKLFLNRAWLQVSPQSDSISPYKLIILYCLYIRVGSLPILKEEVDLEIFSDAAQEILIFLNNYPYETFNFQDLEIIVELISGYHPIVLLSMTKAQAIERLNSFYRLNFTSYVDRLVEEAELELEEPNSSWTNDYEKENTSPIEEGSEFSQFRQMKGRDILSDITTETLNNNYSAYTEGLPLTPLGSPIHFEGENYWCNNGTINNEWDEEELLCDLMSKLNNLYN